MAGRTCPACGCQLEDDAVVCPLCGTAVEMTAPDGAPEDEAASARDEDDLFVVLPSLSDDEEGSGRAVRLPVSRRRLLVGAGAAVVLVVAGLVGWGVWSDAELRRRAEEAEDADEQLVVSEPVGDAGTDQVPLAGDAAAGGALARVGSALYQVRSQGIYRVDGLDASAIATAELVCSARASWLVATEDAIWFLDADAGSAPADFRAHAVHLCRRALEGDATTEVVYAAQGASTLSSCVTLDGSIFFLEHDAEGFAIMDLAEGAEDPVSRGSIDADRAWLIAEDDCLYAVRSGGGSWAVQRARGAQGDLEDLASGQGELEALCLSAGVLYGGIAADAGAPARFIVNDLHGNVAEHADLADAAQIAADGEVVAVLRSDGTASWLNVSTGFTHEVSWVVEEAADVVSPVSSTWAVCGSTIYSTGPDGGACAFEVNAEEGVLAAGGT